MSLKGMASGGTGRAGEGATIAAVLWLAGLVPGVASAHDTWLEQRSAPPGRVELALTSGTLFPEAQTAVAASSLVDRGCRAASGRSVPLSTGEASASALTLHATPGRGDALVACWVQTEAFDVALAERLVPVYLREIGASDALREVWAGHQRSGLPWQERYTKHARISFATPGKSSAGPTAEAAGPSSATSADSADSATSAMALDIEIDAVGTLQAKQTLHFRVLRDGRPLAGQPVELRGELSPLGLWRRTDADGRASVPVPFPGRWVLRATDLRPVPERAGHWESRFITHTFTVAPAADAAARSGAPLADALPAAVQPNSPPMPKARSANQTSATPTISTEPPTITAWR